LQYGASNFPEKLFRPRRCRFDTRSGMEIPLEYTPKKFRKKISTFFEKGVDNREWMWYNLIRREELNTNS